MEAKMCLTVMWLIIVLRRGIIFITLFRLISESFLQHPQLLDMLAKAEFVLKKLWRFGGFLSVEVWAIWFPGSVGESCKFSVQSGLCSRAAASLLREGFVCICCGLKLALLNPFKSPAWLPADLNIFLLSPGFSRACLFNSSYTWEFLCTLYRQWWKIHIFLLWLFQWIRMYYNDNCCHVKNGTISLLKALFLFSS